MNKNEQKSFAIYRTVARSIDPIHVGTGGARLGRVDNTIARDPVTRVPKIPGSSLAGVHRAYAAMAYEESRSAEERHYYPQDAGQLAETNDGKGIINAVFGHKSFTGLAGFSDAQVLLFPVPSAEGPLWITSPIALRAAVASSKVTVNDVNKAYRGGKKERVNLGWLQLEVETWQGLQKVKDALSAFGIDKPLVEKFEIVERLVLVSDKLFSHIVNSNLEVRTSVSIDPSTGAAKDGALFTYEAIPRETVVVWDVICRHPTHFKKDRDFNENSTASDVHYVVSRAQSYLKALGVGGMGTRGMGRVEVLSALPMASAQDNAGTGATQ